MIDSIALEINLLMSGVNFLDDYAKQVDMSMAMFNIIAYLTSIVTFIYYKYYKRKGREINSLKMISNYFIRLGIYWTTTGIATGVGSDYLIAVAFSGSVLPTVVILKYYNQINKINNKQSTYPFYLLSLTGVVMSFFIYKSNTVLFDSIYINAHFFSYSIPIVLGSVSPVIYMVFSELKARSSTKEGKAIAALAALGSISALHFSLYRTDPSHFSLGYSLIFLIYTTLSIVFISSASSTIRSASSIYLDFDLSTIKNNESEVEASIDEISKIFAANKEIFDDPTEMNRYLSSISKKSNDVNGVLDSFKKG